MDANKVTGLGIFVCTRAVVWIPIFLIAYSDMGYLVAFVHVQLGEKQKFLISDDNMQWYMSGTLPPPVLWGNYHQVTVSLCNHDSCELHSV